VPRAKVQGAGSVAQVPRPERELSEDRAPAIEPAVASPMAVVAPMPAAVLRMQATAGNRATSDLLARDSVKQKPKAAWTMTIPKLGSFPLLSFQLPGNDKGDVTVSLSVSDGAPLQGPVLTQVFPTVTIKGAVTITLTDAMITSYSMSGGTFGEEPVLTLAFNAAKREIK
jgi:hypothetical protein